MSSAIRSEFSYRALGRNGRAERGTVAAPTAAEARATLLAQGLLPIELEAVLDATRPGRQLGVAALAVGLRILADLLESGLPMERALAVFEELAPPAWRPALGPMRAAVREGRSLASALEESQLGIPLLVVGMARAGEAGGGIADAIRRAADHAEAAARTRAALRSALAYPLIVALAGCASLGVMLGVVLPRFALILADLGQALPTSTRVVLESAALTRKLFLPTAAAALVASIALREWARSADGRQRLHASLLRLPMVGPLRLAAASSRAAASIAALLASGVPVQGALRFAARAVGDSEVERRMHDAGAGIGRGNSLAVALRESMAATESAIRMIRAGEESGRLVPMLERVELMERGRVERAVSLAVRALEPALILLFACLVGLVAIALLQAVYAVRPL